MGRSKDEIEQAEEAWGRHAEFEDISCSQCGATIVLSERESYFRSKMCGFCEHMSQKDD